MKAIFLISKEGFPIKKDVSIFSPIECVGGYYFAYDSETKLDVVKELELDYKIKPLSELEFLPIEEPIDYFNDIQQ